MCFESGFYKFVTNEGSDFGPINDNENTPRRSYFYILNDTFEIWNNFDWSITHCVLRSDNYPLSL